MIFPLSKWYFDINWHKFEKRWADVFQIYPNVIHLNPLQFCPSMPLLGFPVFCLSSSIVLNRYFHILVNSMTIWSVLKLPKIAWPILNGVTLKTSNFFRDQHTISAQRLPWGQRKGIFVWRWPLWGEKGLKWHRFFLGIERFNVEKILSAARKYATKSK